MSTVTEIESAIEKLPPEDLRLLQVWMDKKAEEAKGRMWSPEELGAAAERMVAEPDPVKAEAMKDRIIAGFYGDAGA